MEADLYEACAAWCVEQLEYPISRTYHYKVGPTFDRVFDLMTGWYKEHGVRDERSMDQRCDCALEIIDRLGGRIVFDERS